mmetsp:Transcript_40989/g.131049  ORF Transcript_40989/g.131049 Transcript_40989/m.131049 type:complete len:209 (+) Transcript_40989:432-1058(+)
MALSASSSAASLPSAHAASRPGAAAGPPLGRRRWQSPALAMSWSSRSPPALRAARGAHTTTGLPSRAAATSLPGFVSHHDAPRCGEVHRGSESPATWRCCRKPLFESCCSGAIHRPSSALLSATDPRPSLPFHSMPVVVWPLAASAPAPFSAASTATAPHPPSSRAVVLGGNVPAVARPAASKEATAAAAVRGARQISTPSAVRRTTS